MQKKLLLSFISAVFTLLFIASPALAANADFTPSDNLFIASDSKIMTNAIEGSCFPRGSNKLERIDSAFVDNVITNDLSETKSGETQIIYSPDLPEPLKTDEDEVCGEANKYLALELEMVKMVNEARAAAGAGELIYSEELSEFARLHSVDMAQNHYFSHTSPTYGTYERRLISSGINYISSGENLARFSCIEDAQKALLRSFGHKKNMLADKYTHVGIGIVWDERLEVYCIAQWFARFY